MCFTGVLPAFGFAQPVQVLIDAGLQPRADLLQSCEQDAAPPPCSAPLAYAVLRQQEVDDTAVPQTSSAACTTDQASVGAQPEQPGGPHAAEQRDLAACVSQEADEGLRLFGGAGCPGAVVALRWAELLRVSGGRAADIVLVRSMASSDGADVQHLQSLQCTVSDTRL